METIPGSSVGTWSMKKTLLIWTPIWFAFYVVLPVLLILFTFDGV